MARIAFLCLFLAVSAASAAATATPPTVPAPPAIASASPSPSPEPSPQPERVVFWREVGEGGWQRLEVLGGRVVAVTRVEAQRAAPRLRPTPPPVEDAVSRGLEALMQDRDLPIYTAPEGTVYHLSRRCPFGKRVDPARRTWFGTEEAAQGAGRQPCRFCARHGTSVAAARRAGGPPPATAQ